jgi:hypothetical protein
MRQLPAHIRSGLALALLILPLAVLAWAADALWSSYRNGTAEVTAKAERLGRYAAIVAQADAVDIWIQTVSAGAGEGLFLDGTDAAVTAAALQSRVADVAGRSGVSVTTFRALEAGSLDGFVDVGVEISLDGPIASLQKTLASIETARPLLVIEKARFEGGERGGVEPDQEPILHADIEVHGFLRARGPAAPKA